MIQSGSGSPASPFDAFFRSLRPRSPLRDAITAAYRRAEPDCIRPLLDLAYLPASQNETVTATARRLVEALRAKKRHGGVEGLIHEYSLSSQEGVALMCLAEALLRIPDNASRDALIRDTIGHGDWRSHLGHSPSLFVNAATWGLVVTGTLTATTSETSLSAALTRLIARGGEPMIRKGVDIAMRMLGEQFVTGQTIDEAIANSRRMEARGFLHSYDMLGEAAATADDARRYLAAYESAIHAIGRSASGRGVYDGPGISIKLSALHPRYSYAQRDRVTAELLPRAKALAKLAKHYDIGLNIDAEEADRLDLSLDVLESLALDPNLAGWNGLGFVIQAYGKRCPFVVDWLVDLAARSQRRLMVRLVKGAYWDSEIKRAQADGLEDFPVFTRKAHTDVCYLACARKLLAAPDAVFPQFATHNAQTLAAVRLLAGPHFQRGQYEFQCLHGMGEPLYEEVVGADKLDRPCRIYAPVGTHETLLAYLVRRLLENGANTSFVNRIAEEEVAVDDLIGDPVAIVRAMATPGAPHALIALPRDLYGADRVNSAGFDLSNEQRRAELARGLKESLRTRWTATPPGLSADGGESIRNPGDRRDIVGVVRHASVADVTAAVDGASAAAAGWADISVEGRAMILRAAADELQAHMTMLVGLIVREAGRAMPNAIAEVREAVDFLRYYAAEAQHTIDNARQPALGPVACISPWNFPLAIFTGQVAAALAAGNAVLAKPAEETPLIAAEAVRILHASGVPADVLHLVPGDGEIGAALVGDPRIQGVVFTGSTSIARLIQRRLADRLTLDGDPVPLIAETGGQNAMIVDSSALAEQVVADVLTSAFDSAGQRCSALRILCLQEEIADRTLAMLRGAMRELAVGDSDRLSTDVGPVITAEARNMIESHIAAMRARGHRIEQLPLPDVAAKHGIFVAPALIEIEAIADVEREVFGPVLHVLRYRRENLDALIDAINATGYGLTFGLHTRIDETIAHVTGRIEAGNIYINRNMIGATVGVQPFGGSGLSGTGPKAGGPHYLRRLVRRPRGVASVRIEALSRTAEGRSRTQGLITVSSGPRIGLRPSGDVGHSLHHAHAFIGWLHASDRTAFAERVAAMLAPSIFAQTELAGPVGERNLYALHPRGRVAALARSETALLLQIGAILVTGNTIVVERGNPAVAALTGLAAEISARLVVVDNALRDVPDLRALLFDGEGDDLIRLNRAIAARKGPILAIQSRTPAQLEAGESYDLDGLVEERTVCINTAAAGGNASLMTIG